MALDLAPARPPQTAEPPDHPRSRRQPATRLTILAIGAVVTTGVVLRFTTSSPMWLDEAQSVAIAGRPVPALFDALRQDGAPPLYYLLLHMWMNAFGTADASARALSGLFAVAALPAFAVLGNRLGGPRAGMAVLLVAAVNPWLVRYATEARMYSLVVLLALLTVISVDRLLTRPTRAGVLGTAAVCAALAYTHYWSLYLLGAVGVLFLVRRLRAGMVALAIAGLLYLPWLPSMAYQWRHTGTPWADGPSGSALADVVREWTDGGVAAAGWLVLLVWPLMLLGAVRPSTDQDRDRRWLLGVVVGALVLAYLAAALTGSAFMGRYTAIVQPLAVTLLGLGMLAVPAAYRWRLASLLLVVWLAADVRLALAVRSQSAEISAAIDAAGREGDVVIYCPNQLAPAITRQLRAPVRQLVYPGPAAPDRVDWVDYAQRNAAADPASFAGTVFGNGTPDSQIWLIRADGYRTFGTDCRDLTDAIAARLGEPARVISADRRVYEKAMLLRWSRVSAGPGPAVNTTGTR
jgi:hypothetical protein